MAFMVVRLVDKVNRNDARADALCSKRGDVIDILPDGWLPRPGDQEMIDAGIWAAVEVNGATIEDLSEFLVADSGDPVEGWLPRRRASSFDVDKWTANGKGRLPLGQALALKNLKARLKDPHVIG